MRLTISRKLFLSFLFVAAVPTAGFAILSQRVTRQLKEQLTATFVSDARRAFETRLGELDRAEDGFFADVRQSAAKELSVCASTDCYVGELERLRTEHPQLGHVIIRDDHGTVFYSDTTAEDHPPSERVTSAALHHATDPEPELLPPVFGDDKAPSPPHVPNQEPFHGLNVMRFVGNSPDLTLGPVLFGDALSWAGFRVPGTARWLLLNVDLDNIVPQIERSGDLMIVTLDLHDRQFVDHSFLDATLPGNGESAQVTSDDGRRFVAYAAAAWENPFAHFLPGTQPKRLLAFVAADQLFAPADRFHRQTLYSLAGFLALALLAASLLSRRFLAAIGRLKSGLESIGLGEQLELSKLSNDELGGELVDSVNQMGVRLAERGRREEIENWGRVIRVLSHEINNTIAPVRSVAAMLNEQLQLRAAPADAGVDLRQASSLIEDRITALGKFVARFGELAKLPAPERHRVDLTGLAVAAARMFTEDAAERHVTVRVLNPAVEVLADVDPGQIERVLINLIKNALEASQNGGDITVSVGQAGGAAHLEVEDRGSGITAEARKNLFVPTFSTKPGGSGIGLAIVRQIAVAHQGWVVAEDCTTGGARFRVVLPLLGDHGTDGATPYRRRR